MKITEKNKATFYTYDEIAIGQVFKSPITENYYMKIAEPNGDGDFYSINITDGLYCGHRVRFYSYDEVIPVDAELKVN
jgi:hypothetical protein